MRHDRTSPRRDPQSHRAFPRKALPMRGGFWPRRGSGWRRSRGRCG
jgi:hypothetical protein